MKTKRDVNWPVIALLIAAAAGLAACVGQNATPSPLNPILNPGDQIDSMILTTGAADAPPLWAFCSPPQENQHVTKTDCRVPPLPKLAIGHTFGVVDQALQTLDWSAPTWELYLDGHPLSLEAFGVYTYVMPDLAPHPSPIREVFRQMRAWDVVLTNLKPGAHTLQGLAQSKTDTYTWIVNLIIEAPHATDFGSTP